MTPAEKAKIAEEVKFEQEQQDKIREQEQAYIQTANKAELEAISQENAQRQALEEAEEKERKAAEAKATTESTLTNIQEELAEKERKEQEALTQLIRQTKITGKVEDWQVPDDKLPTPGVGNLKLDNAQVRQFTDKQNLPSDFRYLYVWELKNNKNLAEKVHLLLNDWGINNVIDGWTESKRYGGKDVCDFGDRKTGAVTGISKDYPVQINKAD